MKKRSNLDLRRGAQLNSYSIDQRLNIKIGLLGHALRVLQKKVTPRYDFLKGTYITSKSRLA